MFAEISFTKNNFLNKNILKIYFESIINNHMVHPAIQRL
jgi:hypothetical protein